MKNRTREFSKYFGLIRGAALLLVGAILAGLVILPTVRPAQAIEVEQNSAGGLQTADGKPAHCIYTVESDTTWQLVSAVDSGTGTSYTYQGQPVYVLGDMFDSATLVFQASGQLLVPNGEPFVTAEGNSNVYATEITHTQTDTMITLDLNAKNIPENGDTTIRFDNSKFISLSAPPEAEGKAVQSTDGYWYDTQPNSTYPYQKLPVGEITLPGGPSLSSCTTAGVYTAANGAMQLDHGEITIGVPKGWTITEVTRNGVQATTSPLPSETVTIHLDGANTMAVTPTENISITAVQSYTVTFASSPDYLVYSPDSRGPITSQEVLPGGKTAFLLEYPNHSAPGSNPAGYTWHDALVKCVVTDAAGAVTEYPKANLTLTEYNGSQYAEIPVTGPCTISFELDFSTFTSLIGVVEKKTDGYWFRTSKGAQTGQPGEVLEALLTVYPAYELKGNLGSGFDVDITQLLALPAGYGGTANKSEGGPNLDNSMDYECHIQYTGDQSGTFPTTQTGPLDIDVIGVQPKPQEIGLVDASGTGYTLTTTRKAMTGSTDKIQATVALEPDYDQSQNHVTLTGLPAGFTATALMPETTTGGRVMIPFEIGYQKGSDTTIPRLTADITATVSGVVANPKPIGVKAISGTGYTLTTTQTAMTGTPGTILATVTLQPGYEQSQNSVTLGLPAGFTATAKSPVTQSDGSVDIPFEISYNQGGDTVIPSLAADITATVSGVAANPAPPPSGGGGGDSSPDSGKPKIRVENNENLPGLSSDTALWPQDIREDGRVCYVSVSDAELDALIDLAEANAEDAENMAGDGYKESIFVIEDKFNRKKEEFITYRLTFTDEQFEKLADVKWDRMTVMTPIGRFSLYDDAIRQTDESGKEQVVFRLQNLDHKGRPGLDVTLKVDETDVELFDQPYGARVFIPYELAEGEDPNAIVIEYIHEDGTVELVTECSYDPEAGGIYFFSSHLSKFGVAYRPSAFQDVGPKHWANPYVTFLASRGVVGGADGRFRPDDPATRAEFIHTLAGCLSAAQLPKRAIQVYSDIPANHYAARAADWVYFNNLDGAMTQGSSFRPSEAISRQDAATLVSNAASGSNLRIRSKGKASNYNDLNKISGYAKEPVKRLSEAGILNMNESHKFFPSNSMNRGEMAQIIATFLSSL